MKSKQRAKNSEINENPSHNSRSREQDARVAIINDALNDNKWITANQLARLCACHRASIVRDIAHMRDELLLPILKDHVKGYSYEGHVDIIPNALMSEGLLFNLTLALQSAGLFRSRKQKAALRRFLNRTTASFCGKTDFTLDDLTDCLGFSQVMTPKFNPELIDFIWRCAVQRVQLQFDYDTPKKGRSHRVINPYLVLKLPRDWVVFCYDYTRRKVIRMSLSRMHNIRTTGKTFIRKRRFSLKKWLKGALEIYTGDKMGDVVIHFSKENAHLIHENNVRCDVKRKELPCGGIELTLRISSFVDLHSWMGSFGDDAIPLSSRKLVEESLAIAERRVEKLKAVLAGTFGKETSSTENSPHREKFKTQQLAAEIHPGKKSSRKTTAKTMRPQAGLLLA